MKEVSTVITSTFPGPSLQSYCIIALRLPPVVHLSIFLLDSIEQFFSC